ncbi:flagellin N-terminal helical domain-containing protein [Pseudobutyrivibrio sp.]|uniref:flagellin N-terminal helical domain-containing protein n=1 Tax=Pseudobutyrivibrio sp. TaxID=2014367 RepID=UPI0025E86F21|nr:flagellin [Pseudobutyrivibrio sp.]MBR5650091.1 flagellar hook protein [Pseudobutyrivibrio sp.]
MVVQHNMQAANASRMLGITTGDQSKSTEKLSSGFKINRAADDAAGLSISEKMRKQIRGLDQASTNASDGISAVQTAEGALTEVHSMLQRMNELAVQAANGTNSESDRSSIQDEINQLTTEIDRVAETTKFNETYLLKGGNGDRTVRVSAHDAGLVGSLSQNTTTATFQMRKLEIGDSYTIGGTTYRIGAQTVNEAMTALKITTAATPSDDKITALKTGDVIKIDGKSFTIDENETDMEQSRIKATMISKLAGKGSTLEFNGRTVSVFSEDVVSGVDQNNKTLITTTAAYFRVKTELTAASSIGATNTRAVTSEGDIGATYVNFTITRGDVISKNTLVFNLHVGSDADMTNKIGVEIDTMDAKSLGIHGMNVSDDTGKAATYAIDAISDALAKVSAQRSALGAIQNRLEHSIANLDNVVENTNAAESRIRDTDMADEMVTYSKNNILMQAGQSMLAQANQATQGVLSILQ